MWFCNFIKDFEKLQIIDLDDSALFKIIYLWHEGSMIGVQCQLVICRGLFSYQRAAFENFYDLQFEIETS